MSEYGATRYIDATRNALKHHAAALLALAWASVSIEQGAPIDDIQYIVMTETIKGVKP